MWRYHEGVKEPAPKKPKTNAELLETRRSYEKKNEIGNFKMINFRTYGFSSIIDDFKFSDSIFYSTILPYFGPVLR